MDQLLTFCGKLLELDSSVSWLLSVKSEQSSCLPSASSSSSRSSFLFLPGTLLPSTFLFFTGMMNGRHFLSANVRLMYLLQLKGRTEAIYKSLRRLSIEITTIHSCNVPCLHKHEKQFLSRHPAIIAIFLTGDILNA